MLCSVASTARAPVILLVTSAYGANHCLDHVPDDTLVDRTELGTDCRFHRSRVTVLIRHQPTGLSQRIPQTILNAR
jgi:hypothetical protein